MLRWHRWFGLLLADYFTDTAYEVRLEEELSLKQQYLDVLILRRNEGGKEPEELPDGLHGLADHNLITYKSSAETLDVWALDELMSHYVIYRKKTKVKGHLLPETDFCFYAVSTLYPRKLLQQVNSKEISSGVFDIYWGVHRIRLIILRNIPDAKSNVLWQIFSDRIEKVHSGLKRYRWHQEEARSLIHQFAQRYHFEGELMPYTLHDFALDFTREHLQKLPAEERLKGLQPEERLKGLQPEELLKGLQPEERIKGMDVDELERLLKKMKEQK